MLKALELNGFKSFADRTRFDFPAGTTIVVGPNGSGKSNVVDAVKWVLGAQSVKSLRGKEMTDVIFSGSKNRRPSGAAEATLVFDNRSKSVDVDAEEIHVSRRVFRSGESEYLINRRPCRLRDIQDLLAKIGVSSGSYTIIEQGKVDALLQASAQQRRVIFEEAAGVSRFRARRREAERRLERIEQNLLRLSDIVDEIQSRLKTVRMQAGKAKRLREIQSRLKSLELDVATHDWRRLDADRDSTLEMHSASSKRVSRLLEQQNDSEKDLNDAEAADQRVQQELKRLAVADAKVRERLAKCESQRAGHLERLDELGQQAEQLSRLAMASSSKESELLRQLEQVDLELRSSANEHSQLESDVAKRSTEFDACERQLAESEDQYESAAKELRQERENLVRLQSQVVEYSKNLEDAQRTHLRQQQQVVPIQRQCEELAAEAASLESALQSSSVELEAVKSRVESLRKDISRDRAALQKTQSLLAVAHGELSGARERIAVLEELEQRIGGLHVGARDVLRQAVDNLGGSPSSVRGLVADLLHVDADTAPLIEIALGDRASHVVLKETAPLMERLAETSDRWRCRTSFLRLDVPAPASAIDRVDLSGEVGVMGRADNFVETDSEFTTLAKRLLGRYWLVNTISTAIRLAEGPGRGLSFVTLAGELISGDGVLSVGPHQSQRGLLSRRTELAKLAEQVAQMQQRREELQSQAASIEMKIADDDRQHQAATSRLDACTRTHSEAALRSSRANERLGNARRQLETVQEQLESSAALAKSSQLQLEECQANIERSRSAQNRLESTQSEAGVQRRSLEDQIKALRQANTDARIDLARCEQQRSNLRSKLKQLESDVDEQQSMISDTRDRFKSCTQRKRDLNSMALELSAELAELYREKDLHAAEKLALDEKQESIQKQRAAANASAARARKDLGERQQEKQQLELKELQIRQKMESLAERIAGQYQVALSDVAATAPEEMNVDLEAANVEIRDLRAQLQSAGSVNVDALEELQELEERHESLSSQLADMQSAREQLQQISQRMNDRCALLYAETLESVRRHFQGVFRVLFGGGEADIVLESGDDDNPLEAGVSIIARPPGKQPRSISLLSGGEKTLTCVALLLAIFRNRPSPFCVLDEVDAALDETNIDRFLSALQQFMGSTQFIVVTHSKRTMTCADTLYGVTMQESGVSKRVSVRFEDVGENGEIRITRGTANGSPAVGAAKRAA